MSGQTRSDQVPDDAPGFVCPLDRAIRVIGGKWKMLLLRSLFVVGPQRYNNFLHSVPGVSPKELTRNLRELERAGLVARRKRENGPAVVEHYALTELGSDLRPAFEALGAFGKLLARKNVAASQLKSAALRKPLAGEASADP